MYFATRMRYISLMADADIRNSCVAKGASEPTQMLDKLPLDNTGELELEMTHMV